jgi:hypothetical protein
MTAINDFFNMKLSYVTALTDRSQLISWLNVLSLPQTLVWLESLAYVYRTLATMKGGARQTE